MATAEYNPMAVAAPETRKLYEKLLAKMRTVGPFEEEVKKTCLHLVRVTAFAGVHARKQHLLVTIKSDRAIKSPRIVKSEQTSKSRWHHDVKLASPAEIDAELLGWLRAAYELSA
jgi:hypothetical protein